MKKLVFLVMISVLFLVGCTSSNEVDYEKLMVDQAKVYYEEEGKKLFQDSTGKRINENLNNYIVKLSDLKNANKYGRNFDLTGLENCTDETEVQFEIDKETVEIKSYEFINKCK